MNSIEFENTRNETATQFETSAVKPSRLEAAAEQFEAMFLRQVLYQMRKAGDVLSSENSLNSKEMGVMRDLYDDVIADQLARQKSLGIADVLVAQLGSKEVADEPAPEAAASRSSLEAPITRNWNAPGRH